MSDQLAGFLPKRMRVEVMSQFRAERNQYGTLRIFCRTPAGPEACVCLRQYNRTTGAYE